MNNLNNLKQEVYKLLEDTIEDPYTVREQAVVIIGLIGVLNGKCAELIKNTKLEKLKVEENLNKLKDYFPTLKWNYAEIYSTDISYIGKSDLITLEITYITDRYWKADIMLGEFIEEESEYEPNLSISAAKTLPELVDNINFTLISIYKSLDKLLNQ